MATDFEAHPQDSLIGVQARLAYLHEQGQLDTSPGAVNGRRNRQTKEAIKAFQTSVGERPNGIASARLKHTLNETCLRVQHENIGGDLAEKKPETPDAPELPTPEQDAGASADAGIAKRKPALAPRRPPSPPGNLAVNPRVFFEDTGEPLKNAYIYCDSLHTPGFEVAEAFVTDAEGRLMRDGRPGFMMDDDEFFVYYSFRPMPDAKLRQLQESECDRVLARERITLTRRIGDTPLLRLEAFLPELEPLQSYTLQLSGGAEKTFNLELTDGRFRLAEEVEAEEGPFTLTLDAQTGPRQVLLDASKLPPADGPLPVLLPIRLEDGQKRPIKQRAVALGNEAETLLFATDAGGYLYCAERVDGVAADGGDGTGKVRYVLGWVPGEHAPSLGKVLAPWLASPTLARLRALDGRSVEPERTLEQLTQPRWAESFPALDIDPDLELVRKSDALCLRVEPEEPHASIEDALAETLSLEADTEVLASAYAQICALEDGKREMAARLQRRAKLLKQAIPREDLIDNTQRHQRLHSLEVLCAALGGNEASPYRPERLKDWQLRSGKSFTWLEQDQQTGAGEARFRSHDEIITLTGQILDVVLEELPLFRRLGLLKERMWPGLQVAVLDARRPEGKGLAPFDTPREALAEAFSRAPKLWQLAQRQEVDYVARDYAAEARGRLWDTGRLGFEDRKGALSLTPHDLFVALFRAPGGTLPTCVFFSLAGRVYLAARRALEAWIHLGALGPRLEQPTLSFLFAQAGRDEGDHVPAASENALAEFLRGDGEYDLVPGKLAEQLGEASRGYLYDLDTPEPRLVSIFVARKLAFSQVAVKRDDFPGLEELFGPVLAAKEKEAQPKSIPCLGAEREATMRTLWRAGGEHEGLLDELNAAIGELSPQLRGTDAAEVRYEPDGAAVAADADGVALGFDWFDGRMPRALQRAGGGLCLAQEHVEAWRRPDEVVFDGALHAGFALPSGKLSELMAGRWSGAAKSAKGIAALAASVIDDWRRLQTGAGTARGLSLPGLAAARRTLLPRILDAWARAGRWLDPEEERELYRALLDATTLAPERAPIVEAGHRVFLHERALRAQSQPEEKPAAPKKPKRVSYKERKRRRATASS